MAGIATRDKLILWSNGDVEDFDPEVIGSAILEVEQKKPFFEQHCLPLGENCCSACRMAACPIADQG